MPNPVSVAQPLCRSTTASKPHPPNTPYPYKRTRHGDILLVIISMSPRFVYRLAHGRYQTCSAEQNVFSWGGWRHNRPFQRAQIHVADGGIWVYNVCQRYDRRSSVRSVSLDAGSPAFPAPRAEMLRGTASSGQVYGGASYANSRNITSATDGCHGTSGDLRSEWYNRCIRMLKLSSSAPRTNNPFASMILEISGIMIGAINGGTVRNVLGTYPAK